MESQLNTTATLSCLLTRPLKKYGGNWNCRSEVPVLLMRSTVLCWTGFCYACFVASGRVWGNKITPNKMLSGDEFFSPLIWNYFPDCILAIASLTTYLEARVWPSGKSIWVLRSLVFRVHPCCTCWCSGKQSCTAVSTDMLSEFPALWDTVPCWWECVCMSALILSRTAVLGLCCIWLLGGTSVLWIWLSRSAPPAVLISTHTIPCMLNTLVHHWCWGLGGSGMKAGEAENHSERCSNQALENQRDRDWGSLIVYKQKEKKCLPGKRLLGHKWKLF